MSGNTVTLGTTQRPLRKRGRHRVPGNGHSLRSLLIGTAVLVAVAGTGGTARAYWRAAGTGSGAAHTGVPGPVVLVPATPAASLYPGGRTGVSLTVSNVYTSAVTIRSLALDPLLGSGGFTVDSAHSGCAVSWLSFTNQDNGGAGWIVPARDGSEDGRLAITLPDALAMDVDATNACQGARITVYLAARS